MDYFLNLTLLSAMLGWLETVLCRVRSSVQLPLMAVNIASLTVLKPGQSTPGRSSASLLQRTA